MSLRQRHNQPATGIDECIGRDDQATRGALLGSTLPILEAL
jgi:hypothetical protein